MPQSQTVYACPHLIPSVRCPGCLKTMSIMVIESAANNHNKITYHCDRCGVEVERVLTTRARGTRPPDKTTIRLRNGYLAFECNSIRGI
jgi:hypothetical protein